MNVPVFLFLFSVSIFNLFPSMELSLQTLTTITRGKAAQTKTYAYDNRGRVISVLWSGGEKDGFFERFGYDAASNLVEIQTRGEKRKLNYDSQNRLTDLEIIPDDPFAKQILL